MNKIQAILWQMDQVVKAKWIIDNLFEIPL